MLIECTILSFDISSKKLNKKEATNLRWDISYKIGTSLHTAGTGKCSGSNCSRFNTMEIFIQTDKPDKAEAIIKSTLDNHWLQPFMQIRRQKPNYETTGKETPLKVKLRPIRMFR